MVKFEKRNHRNLILTNQYSRIMYKVIKKQFGAGDFSSKAFRPLCAHSLVPATEKKKIIYD